MLLSEMLHVLLPTLNHLLNEIGRSAKLPVATVQLA